ncbi:MAG: U32 family peptidase [Bacteriovoracaceae bacterium]|nr:U32 family peptidase [Bacteriovoracaceae bacterium]
MNLSIALYNQEMVDDFLSALDLIDGPKEVIIGFKEISRFFSFTKEECLKECARLKEKNVLVYLQWDVLMTENIFQSVFHSLKSQGLLTNELFSGIRVQDPGALQSLKEINYEGDIHLLCEQGNHNLLGLKSWYNIWPEKIKRIILSPELPGTKVLEYAMALPCDCEILSWGPILLFYTPRALVSPLYGQDEDEIHVLGTSEESPHKGFPIRENVHGTFMLNTKDKFIFDELFLEPDLLKSSLLKQKNLFWRLDFIEGPGEVTFAQIFKGLKNPLESIEELKRQYVRSVTKGFFRVNKTDVLFKKLKNSRLQDRSGDYLGEIVDVKKKKHLGLLIKSPNNSLKLGDRLRLMSPEGNEKVLTVEYMQDALKNGITEATDGDIVFVSPVGGISIRSMVYLDNSLS